MSEKNDKKIRRKARQMAQREAERMVPEFKAFVNTQLNLGERITLAWKIIWKRF